GLDVEPAVGEDVERGGALGDADRVVEAIRQEHDAVPDADLPCPLRDGREEDLGRGGVGELREEVVLDRPHGVEAEPVGERDLLERLVVAAVLAARVVRLRDLELVEQVELHRRLPAVVRNAPGPPGRASELCAAPSVSVPPAAMPAWMLEFIPVGGTLTARCVSRRTSTERVYEAPPN